MTLAPQQHLRNVAIIAHVDHGKTTLVDAMLRYSQVFRENQHVVDLVMDSDPQERERGITILAKNTAIGYQGVTVNIIDTPGHVDFSGEVERVVNMADGCLLLVDAVDGPMPQTRYVLKTAMAQGLRPIVVINKIDRPTARIAETVEAVQDLFLELATDADQLDFPVLYASAREGYALTHLDDTPVDLGPLFEAIIGHIPAPHVDPEGPLQLLVAALDYDNHLGAIAVGRVYRGRVQRGTQAVLLDGNGNSSESKVDHLFLFRDLARHEVDTASAGDIVAVSGIRGVAIGDTIADPATPEALSRISIEEPTVQMTFGVNTSPFAGRDGKYATSRMLWDRLDREIQTNVGLRVERTDNADQFLVSGRGELHLSVLIEKMRREGMEFQVSKPEAITRRIDGKLHEPYELLTIDTREEFIGALTEELASRLGLMSDMRHDGNGDVSIQYKIPTRGLIGFRSFFLRASRGNGVMNTELLEMETVRGEVKAVRGGAIVASESGTAMTYGIKNAQERGDTFIDPQTPIYEGMVVGVQNRGKDLELNICKERKVTNVRSSTQEIVDRLEPAVKFSLEESLDFVSTDELVEVTPKNVRLRKRTLRSIERYRDKRGQARAASA
jgi:GTP-binding protein